MSSQRKRITVKLTTPNPLFEQWLTEWKDQAKSNNSKMQYTFGKALNALKKYPIPLESGKDCIILKGFGKKICEMLDKKLLEHKRTDVTNNNQRTSTNKNITKQKSPKASVEQKQPKSTKGLVTRAGKPQKFSLTPAGETVAASLTNSRYDSVDISNEETVFSKEISASVVNINSTTNNSEQFNKESTSECCIKPETDKLVCSSKSSVVSDMTDVGYTSSQTSTHAETIIFAPHSFDVVLLVDTNETVGGTRNPLNDETVRELTKLDVNFEVRHLKVGDFTWICREHNTKQELVLPFIVERKRMDDLAASIRDGRYYEQKFRLKHCGLQNIMYLVESYGKNTHTALPLTSLMQAATNTLIQDKFQVKFTENHRHSLQYLSSMGVVLKNIYEKKTLINCSKDDCVKTSVLDDVVPLMLFTEFNKNASKKRNFKVQEMFIRQLLKLRGVSVEKALAIVEKYPTPTLLKLEYDKLGIHGEKLLANVPFGPLKRNIGPALSRTIYQLYTINDLNNL